MRTKYIGHKVTNILPVDEIVTVHYFELGKDFKSRREQHNCWEFVYVDKGSLIAEADGKTHFLGQGDGIFHMPDEYHTHSANNRVAPNVFIISFVCKSQGMSHFKNRVLHIPEKLRPLIARILSESQNTFEMPFNDVYLRKMEFKDDSTIGGLQMIRTYLEQFLILLLRDEAKDNVSVYTNRENAEGHIARQMVKTIEDSLYGTKTTVEDICKIHGYSRAYLSRVFKDNYGCTMTEYMSKVRIDEAKRLMREANMNFTQISDKLSFSNPLYFSRVFKRVTGMSPTEYCKSIKIE